MHSFHLKLAAVLFATASLVSFVASNAARQGGRDPNLHRTLQIPVRRLESAKTISQVAVHW